MRYTKNIWLLSFILFHCICKAQSGWIQTQLNGNLGYNLYSNEKGIYASTYNGAFYTSDDGMPWFLIGPSNESVADIISSNQYLLAATGHGIYRSSDNGNSWLLTNGSPSISGSGGVIGSKKFVKNSSSIFIIAWAQGIFRTDDNGENWHQIYLGNDGEGFQDYAAAATCIESVGERIIIGRAWEYPFSVYYSDDNGESWSGTQIPRNDNKSDQLLCFYNFNGSLLAGGFLGLYISHDSGSSWSPQYESKIGTNGEVIGLGAFRSVISYNEKLIAAVDFNSIQISNDNGKNWSSFNEGLISDWTFGALAIKPPFMWAITNIFGNAYRRNLTETVTDIKSDYNLKVNEYWLSQNYPNPFNPNTKIKFSIPKTQFVTIKVYDLLGKEIATLLNEIKLPGNYEVEFNGSFYSNGIYFYKLYTDDYQMTKKLIIMK